MRHPDFYMSVEEVEGLMKDATPLDEPPPGGWEGFRRSSHPPPEPKRTADSFRAPRERGRARNAFCPVPITELGPSAPPDWVWDGYLARGHITLFSGVAKGGKTTLIKYLVRDLRRGGGLVGKAKGLKILILSEESAGLWCRRREDLGLGPEVHIQCRVFRSKPSQEQWELLIRDVAEYVRKHGISLVIIDTLAAHWPVVEENDASPVIQAVLPISLITDEKAAVLLVHHPRKSGGEEGQASRGSSALPGAVDIIMELRRHNASDSQDRRRTLKAYSRFDETPAEVVIELTEDDRYRIIGDAALAKRIGRMEIIDDLLPVQGGLTSDEVLTRWPGEPKPGARAVGQDLAGGVKDGRWKRHGRGKKNDPYRYTRNPECDSRTHTLLSACNESNTSRPSAEGSDWGVV